MCLTIFMKFRHCLFKILKKKNREQTDGQCEKSIPSHRQFAGGIKMDHNLPIVSSHGKKRTEAENSFTQLQVANQLNLTAIFNGNKSFIKQFYFSLPILHEHQYGYYSQPFFEYWRDDLENLYSKYKLYHSSNENCVF